MIDEWLHPALIGIILLCSVRLAWVDMRSFEIETPTLILLAGAALSQALLHETGSDLVIRGFAAAAFYGSVLFLTRNVRGFSRIGAGDPPLIGVVAFMVFPLLLPWAILAGVLILVTAFLYSMARGKRFLRSMFPAAPPLLGAAVPVYLLQVSGA